jgi:hypothetical protein
MNGNGQNLSLELDAGTAQLLEQLAHAWGVSKEEAVKRAVTQAEAAPASVKSSERLQAFKELQRRLQLTPEKAAAWQGAVRDARR